MRLAVAVDTAVRLRGRPPFVVGNQEVRFPAKTLALVPGEFPEVTEDEARHVMLYCGTAGVVPVGFEFKGESFQPIPGGETDEAALLRAKIIRREAVLRQLRYYREEQAKRLATGLEVILPRDEHRAWLKEYRQLEAELPKDEVLTADIPGITPIRELEVDPIKQELDQFGLGNAGPARSAAGVNDLLAGL